MAVPLLMAVTACSNPAKPSPSLTAPSPLSPTNGALVQNAAQPVTLVVINAVATSASVPTTYGFEVATDSAFGNKVQTRDGVAEGSTQTALTLGALPPNGDYYWHARATNGGTVGAFGPTYKFTIGPAITLNPPVPVSPLTGSQTGSRPTLTVTDSTRQGSVGAVFYKFEIAANNAFAPVIVSALVAEGNAQTSFTSPTDLTGNQTYYWRATALDQTNNVSSPASAAQSFAVSLSQAETIALLEGATLWPGTRPPGNAGQAVLGANWQVQTLRSFNGITFVSPTIEELRVFDLLDRGIAPDAALIWMNGNGYPTAAAYYPSVAVIGFEFEYMALIGGQWELVVRVGA